jgi:hypothetical protein
MKKKLSMDGVKPISEETWSRLDDEFKGYWRDVANSKPRVYIPRGFALITEKGHPLEGQAVPRVAHCGLGTGLCPPTDK